ncbi:MAG: NYN domain-containing protein [Anaerolineae bacterium]|nr:NYN domain-containing protein [Anaerolineae bacterium]
MVNQGHEVALFIDFENIHTSIKRSTLNAHFVDWGLLLEGIEHYGRIAIRHAYANWGEHARHQTFLNRFAIEPRNAFGGDKNVSDIFLAVEAMETLYTHPEIATYILVTGDGDFSVLVQRLRNHHKTVIGVGVRDAAARGLVEACDEYIFYDDLLAERQPAGYSSPPERRPFQKRYETRYEPAPHSERRYRPREAEWTDFEEETPFSRNNGFRTPGPLTLEDYLSILERNNPRITPTQHRPSIILRIYELMQSHQPATLNELKAVALENFQAHPEISGSLVEEVIHQLYHTYSFEFDRLPDVPQWDRPCRFQAHIQSKIELLDNCDMGVLKRLQRGLPGGVNLDSTLVARLLYGNLDNPRVLQRSEELLEKFYTG